MSAIVAALVCATLLLLAYKPPAIALRIVALFEHQPTAGESVDVPSDLLSLIQSRYPRNPGQEWAFDGAVESVREMYQHTKNWDVVRQQFANAA